MTLKKAIFKIPLDILAFLLRQSKDAVYYLVNEGLRDDIKTAVDVAYAHEHIENACFLARKYENTGGGVILDVGGGAATTALRFSKYFPEKQVYIFEPIAYSFDVIRKTANNRPDWILINKAVGSKSGTSKINISNRITASSLLEMQNEVSGYESILVAEREETIQIVTLDETIGDEICVSVLKIDVQGFELEVLKGAENTLKKTSVIVLEVNNHQGFRGAPTYFEIDEFLRARDFELFDLYPSLRSDGRLQDWDAIYVKQK